MAHSHQQLAQFLEGREFQVEEMARYLEIDLRECTLDGSALRVAPQESAQPADATTRQKIVNTFLARFDVIAQKPYSGYLEVKPKETPGGTTKGPIVT